MTEACRPECLGMTAAVIQAGAFDPRLAVMTRHVVPRPAGESTPARERDDLRARLGVSPEAHPQKSPRSQTAAGGNEDSGGATEPPQVVNA